jgi:hypothetical protein
MTDSERDHLRAELEHDKTLITQSRKLIARNRASIADAEKHFADSFDRLADSQKLARGQQARGTPVVGDSPWSRPERSGYWRTAPWT